MLTYLLGTSFTTAILLNALLRDNSISKSDVRSWLVLGIASLLWFITIPCILRKKFATIKVLPVSL
jgi:hypothetical protein